MTTAPDLVTVVVPAYNAERTIDETLRSVRAQTHDRLEILVVDDGSDDATAQIVRRHCAEDPRVRLIRQPNAGVAAARNRGVAEAMGDLLAPIDADDLWHPEKIEKQLATLHRSGDRVALVYTWSAIIDAGGRVISARPGAGHAGVVIDPLLRGNFVGNGSAPLMRKAAVIEAGGYDPSLRARRAQGLEDYQLYFRIATRHQFALVAEHLTGYRRTAASMSADVRQMLRARDILAEEMSRRYPERCAEIAGYRSSFLGYLYHLALSTGRIADALLVAALLLRESPLDGAARVFLTPGRALLRRGLRRVARPFRGDPHAMRGAAGRFLAVAIAFLSLAAGG